MINKLKYISGFAKASFAYPLIMLGSLYLTWFVAWAVLGHPPRPSLDDPKYISTLVNISYAITKVLIIAAPGALVLGLGLIPLHIAAHTTSKKGLLTKSIVPLLLFAGLWCTTLIITRIDPWNVGKWFMD
jgi:cation transport ATPase